MNVSRTNNKEIIKSIVTHPDLFELTGHVGSTDKYTPYLGDLWLLIKEADKIIGLGHFKQFTKVTADSHFFILPEYQNGKKSLEAAKAVIEYLKQTTYLKSLIVTVPVVCVHVQRFVRKLGFLMNGVIKNGIVYKGQLQTLVMYQLEL